MKKILALLLVFAMTLSLAACGGSTGEPTPEAAPEAAPADDVRTVAVAFCDQTEGQATMHASYEAYAEKLGINFIYTNAEANLYNQVANVESLAQQSPDVLIIHAADADGIVTAAEEVQNAGIPVIDGLYGLNSENITTHCVASMEMRGIMQAEILIEYLEANPESTLKIGHIQGTMNSQTTDIANGFYKTLDELIKAGRVEVVAEQAADHSSDKATALAEDWITAFEDINCIVADSDEMALAAMNAYLSAGYDLANMEFLIVGADLTARAKEAIANGTMYGTVQNDFDALARIILDVAVEIMDGKTVDTNIDMAEAGFMKKITKANLPG